MISSALLSNISNSTTPDGLEITFSCSSSFDCYDPVKEAGIIVPVLWMRETGSAKLSSSSEVTW